MGISPDSNKADFHVLIYMEMRQYIGALAIFQPFRFCTGKTCEKTGCADSDHDGTWWGIAKVPKFENGLGDMTSDKVEFPEVTIELYRDSDATQQSLFDWSEIRANGYLYGYGVDLYIVNSTDPLPKSTNKFFSGYIPKGAVEIDETKCTIRLTDRREMDDKKICRKTFEETGNVDAAWEGKPIPVLLGDFATDCNNSYGLDSGFYVEAVVTNTDNSGGTYLQCKLCRPGESGIASFGSEAIWVDSSLNPKGGYNGANLTIGSSVLSTGYCEIVGSNASTFKLSTIGYGTITDNTDNWTWADGDKILMKNPIGDIGIYYPSQIIYHLLTDEHVGLNIDLSYLDLASFLDCDGICGRNDFYARCWISDDSKTVMDCIGELQREFLFKLVVINDIYHLIWLPKVFDSFYAVSDTIYEHQIVDWKEAGDMDGNGIADITINYRQNFASQKSIKSYPERDSDAEAEAIEHDHDTLDAYWIYTDESAWSVAAYMVQMRGTYVQWLELTIDHSFIDSGLKYYPGQKLKIEWPEQPDGANYIVINCDYNFENGQAVLTVVGPTPVSKWIIWSRAPGVANDDDFGGGTTPDDYATADADQIAMLSFWHDDPAGSRTLKYWSP